MHFIKWFLIDTGIVFLYGVQHSLLTTKAFHTIFDNIFNPKLWNLLYSILSIYLLYLGYKFWESSNVTIYKLDGFAFYFMCGLMSLWFFLFFYSFKFTTSFFQWIGISQLREIITEKKGNEYYRVRKNGFKKYVRFPHHTFLILLFWSQPIMTLDTLWLAILATSYTWIGTVHQDKRGQRILGKEWLDYSQATPPLLFPNLRKIFKDIIQVFSRRVRQD